MNNHVHAISGRLSLRPPQKRALEILAHLTTLFNMGVNKNADIALPQIRKAFPSFSEFEREFPSFCFALATGVGKTRLMGAFIAFLHLQFDIGNFFVLAPNLTIYNKLIADFSPGTPKYVFKGIGVFAINTPEIITGENYENASARGVRQHSGLRQMKISGNDNVRINIFNISKINSEVRGGKAPKIKRLSEYIGQSYFDYLANLSDLVLIMDESHRYRASAGIRAINELKPIIGLELTATPFTESPKGPIPFKNVVFDYPLGKAMEDGFVKEPAVITRKDFDPKGMGQEELERLKIEDGIRLHEKIKVELETYARETNKKIVKPFLLIIARDTTHAGNLLKTIQSEPFFGGRYKEKVIQVDSSKTGAEEDLMVERLLKVEDNEEPTEIVIHVNMLKEGWDVTNLYTIIPLRAANARTLIEQSIGRGLRLPYGVRTGHPTVDRLNIIAHDKFQEIIDEARKNDSPIRLKEIVLSPEQNSIPLVTVVSQTVLATKLGFKPYNISSTTYVTGKDVPSLFKNSDEEKISQITFEVVQKYGAAPLKTPTINHLNKPEILAEITALVKEKFLFAPKDTGKLFEPPDIPAIVAAATRIIIDQTINIPRITVVPKGEVKCGFKPFQLKLATLNYPPVSEDLWAKHLRTEKMELLSFTEEKGEESRIEDFIVKNLVDYDDISYDHNADLLYDLSGQVINHFKIKYPDEAEVRKVIRIHQKDIARFIHAQMQDYFWEEALGYEVKVNRGFIPLKEPAFTQEKGQGDLDFRQSPQDKSNMAKYLFGGFQKCLYHVEKFHSDAERKFSIILERESQKWFRPIKGQFNIWYKLDGEEKEYQPDFVAETEKNILMVEVKRKDQMETPEVLAKKEVALKWCKNAADFALSTGGKPWVYLLIPHDKISENITLENVQRECGG